MIPERAVSQLPLSQIGGEEVVDKFLFLDEAVSHLDLKHQRQLLQITKKFCDNRFTAIVILHDINLSLTYADRILFMKEGRIAYELKHRNQITPAILKDVFDVDATIIYPNEFEKPVVVF